MPRKFLLLSALVMATASLSWYTPNAEAATLLYSNAFDGDLGDVNKEFGCHPYSYALVTSPVRSGTHSVRHLVNGKERCVESDRVYRHRTSLKHGYKAQIKFEPRKPYWVGFSMFVPNNDYPLHRSDAIIFLGFAGSRAGETMGQIRGSNLDILRRWRDNDGVGELHADRVARVPVKQGKWTDIVLYLYRSWESDGVLRVWIDGKLVVDVKGPNAVNWEKIGTNNPNFRHGIYFVEDRNDNYTLYYDSVKIALGENGYDLVSPTGSNSQSAPSSPTGLRVSR